MNTLRKPKHPAQRAAGKTRHKKPEYLYGIHVRPRNHTTIVRVF